MFILSAYINVYYITVQVVISLLSIGTVQIQTKHKDWDSLKDRYRCRKEERVSWLSFIWVSISNLFSQLKQTCTYASIQTHQWDIRYFQKRETCHFCYCNLFTVCYIVHARATNQAYKTAFNFLCVGGLWGDNTIPKSVLNIFRWVWWRSL